MATSSLDTPNVELVYDMANDVYHARKEFVSRSQAHRYRGVLGGRAQRYAEVARKSLFAGNSSTTFGTIVDTAFEAEVRGIDWRSRCAVAPPSVLAADGSRRGKAFQSWKASLDPAAIECSETDFGKVADMIASLREHRGANALMEACTHSQLSVFWTNSSGHKLKARADGVTPELWFDLKTTSSEWRDLRYSFRRFGYDWQHSWYTDAALAAGWPPFEFKFIVVQTFAPFDVKVVKLTPDAVERARIEIDETLFEMRRRAETGEYVAESYHEEEVLDLG
jgi:hypothetical protein